MPAGKILGIKRKWKPEEAEAWRKEDWLVIIISPFAYAFLMVGLALLLFLQTSGVFLFGLGVIATILIHFIIDPKLKAISAEYEKKQKEYLERLDRVVRWRENE